MGRKTAQETIRGSRVGRWVAGVLLAALAAGCLHQKAEAQRPSRDEIEAAYLYNFGKFVRWPSGSDSGPLAICMAAPDSLRKSLTQLVKGETISGRPLEVRALDRPGSGEGCSILFVGSADTSRIDGFLAATAGKPVLTVGDSQDFLLRGGAIQFVLADDHVRFAVNLNAASRQGLSLSSELLKVAVSVTGRPQTGGAR